MKLKKHFGQHFLTDESISQQIATSLLHLPSESQLLEIGPGGGAITKYLMTQGWSDYRLVEIDEEKVDYLINTMSFPKEKIIHQDILKVESPFTGDFVVIGNFPYNISSQILFKILEWKDQVKEVVGMFQKEVAVRIASAEGNKDYGILSVLVQAYYDVSYLLDVPPSAFVPPPQVMSGVIRMNNSGNKYNIARPDKFQRIVKQSFAMRRKTMRNNLKGMSNQHLVDESILDKRAEQLSVQDFVNLYKTIYEEK